MTHALDIARHRGRGTMVTTPGLPPHVAARHGGVVPTVPMMGREAERTATDELLDAVRDGLSGTWVLVGVPRW